MNYYTIKPSPLLAPFIRFYWVLESNDPYTHVSMPDVCPELLFHYRGRFLETFDGKKSENSFVSGVHGPSSKPRTFTIGEGFGIFGIYLYPQTVSLLFNQPASEFKNEMPDLSLLMPGYPELEDIMLNATGNKERHRVAEAFLSGRILRQKTTELPIFHSIRQIIEQKGLTSVRHIAREHFLSERQFERQFQRFSGFSPRLFARILRFHSAMALYGKGLKSLTAIALESGYYDQSHFIRDFKHFSGLSPRAYFSGITDATPWKDGESSGSR